MEFAVVNVHWFVLAVAADAFVIGAVTVPVQGGVILPVLVADCFNYIDFRPVFSPLPTLPTVVPISQKAPHVPDTTGNFILAS